MESLITLITNSTFNTEQSMNGFHTLKLTEEEHKALKNIVKENDKLKEEIDWKKIDLQKEVKRNEKLKEEINDTRKFMNILLDLIKDCDTQEKLAKLKELPKLDE